MKPLVSIIIPVFNGADFLREAIESALNQTYPNVEILVINDGSDDNGETEKIALSYDDKIRYFAKDNGGVASALNTAISKMRGEYFSWLSHDDLYVPEKIQEQISVLIKEENPLNCVVYSNFATFEKNPDVNQVVSYPSIDPENFRYFLACGDSVHGCTLLVPRYAFTLCGFFDERLRTTQDYDMWFRLASHYKFVHIAKVLVKARQHEAQGTKQLKPTVLAECNEILMKFITCLSLEEIIRASGRSAALAYAEASFSYSRLGFNRAASVASRYSLINMSDALVADASLSLWILIKSYFIRLRLFASNCLRLLKERIISYVSK